MLTYEDRISHCTNPVAKTHLALMTEKESNLCVNPDLTTCEEVLSIADKVGPSICVLKTHVDIDTLGQQYNTPEHAILKNGVDIIIVGRGIFEAENPTKEAEIYREAGWNAYQKKLKLL